MSRQDMEKAGFNPADIAQYVLFVVLKRKLLLLAAAVLTFSSIVFFSYLITPTWEGTTKILVERSSKQSLTIFRDVNLPIGSLAGEEKSNVNLLEILTGENMAYDIAREFKLDESERRKRFEPRNLREHIKNLMVDVMLSPVTLLQAIGVLEEGEKNWLDDAAEEFQEDWEDVEADEGTPVIQITVNGESRELAMAIPKRMVELLRERTMSFTRSGAVASHRFVQAKLGEAESNLREAEDDLRHFKAEHDIVNMDEEKRLKLIRLDGLEAELDVTRKQAEENAARLSEVNRELARQPERVVMESIIQRNPVATELEASLQSLEIKLASLLTEKREKHPDVQQLEAEINRNRDSLKAIVQETFASRKESYNPIFQSLLGTAIDLRTEAIALSARADALAGNLAGLRRELLRLEEQASELLELQTLVSVNTTLYESLKRREEELAIEKETDINEYNIRVLDEAYVSPSDDADWPMWPLTILAGLVLAFVFGFGSIFAVEYWNDAVVSPRDAEELLQVPCLGSVPDMRKKDRRQRS